MADEERSEPITVPEAARILGKSLDTIRAVLRRGSLVGFKDNQGEWRVYLPVDARQPEPEPAGIAALERELAQARESAETWRRQAEDRGAALAEARTEARLVRETLDRELARCTRLEAELAELRRPWWRRLLGR
jgi:hypothetical protein